jgi:hypothetical protein
MITELSNYCVWELVFFIRSRESKEIDTHIKLVKYQTDYQITRANVDWVAVRLAFKNGMHPSVF